jgi:uncharacterized protein (DUF1330 family)
MQEPLHRGCVLTSNILSKCFEVLLEAGFQNLPLGCKTWAPADSSRTVESPDFSIPIKFLIIANGMNTQLKTVAAVFAGVGIGIAAMHGVQGGQAKPPPAFVISNIEVTDPAGYQKYGEAAAAVVASYHGKILARGGKAVVFDGRAPQRVVVIEFPSLADAERWRSSPEF